MGLLILAGLAGAAGTQYLSQIHGHGSAKPTVPYVCQMG